MHVHLTPTGKRIERTLLTYAPEVNAAALIDFSAAESKTLRRYLERIQVSLARCATNRPRSRRVPQVWVHQVWVHQGLPGFAVMPSPPGVGMPFAASIPGHRAGSRYVRSCTILPLRNVKIAHHGEK